MNVKVNDSESIYIFQIQQPLKHVESLVKILSVVNFCLFLFQNRYPTLATRLLGLPIVSIHRRIGASAGYSYQIRELLWHQFAVSPQTEITQTSNISLMS